MPASRPPASHWRRLALSLGLSLTLHGFVLQSFGSANVSPFGSATGVMGAVAPALTVTLLAYASPAPVVATLPVLTSSAPEPDSPTTAQDPAATVPGAAPPEPLETASPGAAIPSGPSGIISGPWYYSARYLHRRPTPLKPIRPIYPQFVGDLAGHVVLLLLINELGTVDTYRVLKATPAGIFDNSVVTAFMTERYAPGLITGYPVKSQLLVEVFFEPGAEPRTDILLDLPR